MRTLATGQQAPDFELPDQNGNFVRLSAVLQTHCAILFFYPKDDTTGCTKEACGFRDSIADIESRGARVIGISSDSPDSHARFAAKFGLPYTLLSDRDGKVRRLYGVKRTFGIVPGRVTFVIGRDGLVRHVFNSQSDPERHVTEATSAL
jgi:peroxiredoxin Q/BCP